MLAYGYTVHSNNIQKVGEVPTVRLNYDILPIVVQFSEKSSSFYHFLTQVYTCTTATAEAAYTSRCITHGHGSAEATAALADLEAAEAAEERARAPVNFPKNYAFSGTMV